MPETTRRDKWNELKDLTNKITLKDEAVTTDVEELARLRKVINYVDELLRAADPELLPQSMWNNLNDKAHECANNLGTYIQARDIVYMRDANNNLDNILSYVRPYVVSGKGAAQAAGRAFKAYADTVTENMDLLKEKTQSDIKEIQHNKSKSDDVYQEIEESKNSIQTFRNYLFNGTDEEESLKKRFGVLFDETKERHSKIHDYFQKLTEGNEQETAIILQIDNAKEKAIKDREAITSDLESVQEEIEDLNDFYITVFGEEKEDGSIEGGLKKELEARLTDLEDFKKKQQKAYTTLIEQINSLLPGATSVGLANAYSKLKDDSETKVTKYTKRFYWSLAGLSLMAAISVVQNIGGAQLIEFIDVRDPLTLLQRFIYKLPLIIPLFWMTLFSSKRRSEFQRLEQEYAHKEALAESYLSFKDQIERLNEEDGALMEQLLESVITAISFNASKTLDGKHGDKSPTREFLENTMPFKGGKQ